MTYEEWRQIVDYVSERLRNEESFQIESKIFVAKFKVETGDGSNMLMRLQNSDSPPPFSMKSGKDVHGDPWGVITFSRWRTTQGP
jgi:hypothetical protein